jgi:hypothetical protein
MLSKMALLTRQENRKINCCYLETQSVPMHPKIWRGEEMKFCVDYIECSLKFKGNLEK